MAKLPLQSERYEKSYFHMYNIAYYCLGKNSGSKTLSSNFIRSQNPYQLQNLNVIDISGAQKPIWTNFLEFEFFLSEKTRLHRYHHNKNQLRVTSSSYTNHTIKKLIKSYLSA